MGKNRMEEVAELLGVEIGKPFSVDKTYETKRLIFKNDGLYYLSDANCKAFIELDKLLSGYYEVEKPILDEAEKKYLENVIRPFKHNIISIRKRWCVDEEYIEINYYEMGDCTRRDKIMFPCFLKGAMYKGMELSREYTLEELGLFQNNKGE